MRRRQHGHGVYAAARALDLSIGEDLSVVGFNDLPVAALSSPPLTTVRLPLGELGSRGCGPCSTCATER
nr:substrate-binding domain-containing protein [Streptomyces clavuligerus]